MDSITATIDFYMGGRTPRCVKVRSIRAANMVVDHVTEQLVELLERRFANIDHGAIGDICDAALSHLIEIRPGKTGSVNADELSGASLRFAEAVYTVIRDHHRTTGRDTDERMHCEWGFSGFYGWFEVHIGDIVAGVELEETAPTQVTS